MSNIFRVKDEFFEFSIENNGNVLNFSFENKSGLESVVIGLPFIGGALPFFRSLIVHNEQPRALVFDDKVVFKPGEWYFRYVSGDGHRSADVSVESWRDCTGRYADVSCKIVIFTTRNSTQTIYIHQIFSWPNV